MRMVVSTSESCYLPQLCILSLSHTIQKRGCRSDLWFFHGALKPFYHASIFSCHFPAVSPTSLLTSRMPNGRSRNGIYMVLSSSLLRHCQLTLHTISHLKVSGYRKRISSVETQGNL